MSVAEMHREAARGSGPVSPGTILVVDDNELVRGMIESMLGHWGYSCVTATDGLAAIATAARQPIALVLTDYQMPNMNGLELLARLKEYAPALPVIILSSDDAPEQVEEARRRGAFAWVVKPVDPARLRQLVSSALPA
jgi:two-component system response regulator HydG